MTNKQDWFVNPSEITVDTVPKFDFHMHTTWTDGTASTADMYAQAVAEGLEVLDRLVGVVQAPVERLPPTWNQAHWLTLYEPDIRLRGNSNPRHQGSIE